jgi:hypothetical protein
MACTGKLSLLLKRSARAAMLQLLIFILQCNIGSVTVRQRLRLDSKHKNTGDRDMSEAKTTPATPKLHPVEIPNLQAWEMWTDHVQNSINPWIEATKNWRADTEKLRQASINGLTQLIDTGASLTRMSLGMAYSWSSIFHGQMLDRMEDNFKLIRWPTRTA